MRLFLIASLLVLSACESAPALGTACVSNGSCASPLVCRLGRCRGECVENRDCPIPTRCLLDPSGLGSCSLDTDERCESGGHECPSGLICVGDQCANSCGTDADCPADGRCREAETTGVQFCFAADREDGGAPMDAGHDAATQQHDAAMHDAASPDDAATSDTGTDAFAFSDSGPCVGSGCGRALNLCATSDGACALRDDNHVLCWGYAAALGDEDRVYELCGGFACSMSPIEVRLESGAPLLATSLACGEGAVCARTSSSDVYCWGNNSRGALGRGVVGTTIHPARVDATAVRGVTRDLRGGAHAFCAIDATDGVTCWGENTSGRFAAPSPLVGPTSVDAMASVAIGSAHMCSAGGTTVSCSGTNVSGQLGPHGPLPTDGILTTTPVLLDAFAAPITSIGATRAGTCVLAGTEVWCWGSADCGVLGEAGGLTPRRAGTGSYVALWTSASSTRACAQTAAGATDCWGDFELDVGSCAPGMTTPTHEPAFDDALTIALGHDHWCMIDATGSVQCAGGNGRGQLARRPSFDTFDGTLVPVCIDTGCIP